MTNINDTIEFIAGTHRAIANNCTAYTNINEMREYLLDFGLWCVCVQTKYVMPFGRAAVAVSASAVPVIRIWCSMFSIQHFAGRKSFYALV